jgi:hypothetical protein
MAYAQGSQNIKSRRIALLLYYSLFHPEKVVQKYAFFSSATKKQPAT